MLSFLIFPLSPQMTSKHGKSYSCILRKAISAFSVKHAIDINKYFKLTEHTSLPFLAKVIFTFIVFPGVKFAEFRGTPRIHCSRTFNS